MMATRVRPDREIFNRYYSTPKEQEGGKYITLAQELGKNLDDLVRFTFSSEEFKNKYGENLGEFDKRVILLSIILKNLEKVPEAERDEELKKLLPSLQEKMKVINENIEKIAKELGYTVSYYPLDKLLGDLDEVKKKLDRYFGGKQLELRDLFSEKALDILTDLFALIVNKYPIGSVNASVAVPIISDKNNKTEDKDKQKGPEEKVKEESESVKVLQQQPQKEHHNLLREWGKKAIILGLASGIIGGALVAGSSVLLPLMGFGLFGMALATVAGPIVFAGVAIWMAGVIGDIYKGQAQKAQEKALKEEDKRKKALEKEEEKKKRKEEEQKNNKKAIEETEEKYRLWKATNAEKDEEALKKQLTDSSWLEKHIKAEAKAEHEKRVKEAKEAIEKIMEEEKKLGSTIPVNALHDLLIEKAKDPNTPSWFLALLAQLRLSHFYTDVDMLKALAGNPNTPPELLADFATRKRYFWTREYIGSDIREIAAKNPSTPPEILAKLLLGDKDPRVEYAVAANPRTPTDALDTAMYSKKVDRNIKVVIAMNPSTSPDALEYALKDKDLALYALYNPSISKYPYLLELALKNPDRSVSDLAQKILEKRIKELEEQNKGNENK
jgi:hypothetical protein